jgi:hypothetical protein
MTWSLHELVYVYINYQLKTVRDIHFLSYYRSHYTTVVLY